jgi:hypothetical protein
LAIGAYTLDHIAKHLLDIEEGKVEHPGKLLALVNSLKG